MNAQIIFNGKKYQVSEVCEVGPAMLADGIVKCLVVRKARGRWTMYTEFSDGTATVFTPKHSERGPAAMAA
jgi:hypothetical protein